MDNTNTNDGMELIGQVYKLTCNDKSFEECYIGSTINLYSRLHKHKYNATNTNSDKFNLTIYKKIRENGGWNNWSCSVLETTKNPTRTELIQLERKHYELNKELSTLNTKYCGRSKKEGWRAWKQLNPDYCKNYQEKNKDKLKKYCHKYYDENREKLQARNNMAITCECGSIVNRSGLARHRRTQKHLNNI